MLLTFDNFSIGRRPVFYLSAAIIILGRIMTTLTTSTYILFAIASLSSMLTSMSIFLSPLIIAMETSKEADRAHIAMMQVISLFSLTLTTSRIIFTVHWLDVRNVLDANSVLDRWRLGLVPYDYDFACWTFCFIPQIHDRVASMACNKKALGKMCK